jgi:anti-sigma-K factor RskA
MADTSHQTEKHVEDQIDAYALGILEDEAAAEVERHLEHCNQCQRALRQAREVTSMLSLAPEQVAPPLHLKQRILSRIAQEEGQRRPETRTSAAPERRTHAEPDESTPPDIAIQLPDAPSTRRGWKRWVDRMVSGRSTAPAAVGPQGTSPTPTGEHLETILRLLHSPHAAMWELAGTPEAPRAHARLLGSPEERTAILLVQGLEPLPPGRDYQLWFLREGKPVGSAIFDVRQNGQGQLMVRAPRQLAHYDLAAITPEPAGGSPGPTGPIVIAGELKAA